MTYPVVGSVTVVLEVADDATSRDILDAANELAPNGELEWEYVDRVARGNVLYHPHNVVTIDGEEVEEEDEE